MPERDPDAAPSARLLRGLVWAGVLLAPPAAAIVLLGHGAGSMRFAVLLLAVSIVLIGASVLIRSDPVLQRMHVEDRLAEEAEALRAEFARAAAAMPDPRREPVVSGGGRVVAAASASASVPRGRGAASVPMLPGSPSGPPRASSAVRPGAPYGRPDRPDSDVGAGDGYDFPRAMPPPGVYGGSARVRVSEYASGYDAPDDGYRQTGDGYGSPGNGHGPPGYGSSGDGYGSSGDGYGSAGDGYGSAGDGYGWAGDEYGPTGYSSRSDGYSPTGFSAAGDGYGPSGTTYGRARGDQDDYGYGRPVEEDSAGYGLVGGYDGRSAGDPSYRAKRHRPSANDTNVGTYAEFEGDGGWSAEPRPDERYVHGYGRSRR